MARAEVGVREFLLSRFRDDLVRALDFDERCRTDPEFMGQPYAHIVQRKLDALEAGEPVEVYEWDLPKPVQKMVRTRFGNRVTVLPDGTFTDPEPPDRGR